LLSPARLFGFLRLRINAHSFVSRRDVYRISGAPERAWPKQLGALFVLGQLVVNMILLYLGDLVLLAIVPGSMYLLSMVIFAIMPEGYYHESRVKPDISLKSTTLQRFTCYFVLFNGLAWLAVLTGRPVIWYWLLLWAIPLVTIFPLYVLLRQFVQHGNGGRGRLTNTRVFLGPSVMNFFLMPVGQDYHLPHHLFASIPHYRLRQLHDEMMRFPDYRSFAMEIDGVVRGRHEHKSVVDVLGMVADLLPDGTFIDSTVLDEHDVAERDAIQAEERASAA
jgi:hypothetical protein